MANVPRMTRADLEKGIVQLAATDESFRQQLLADPKQALKDGGFELPAGVDIKVVQAEPNVIHLVLPAKLADGELADQELAGVAGGLGTLTTQTATLSPTGTLAPYLSTAPIPAQTAASAAQQLPDPRQSGWSVSWP